MDPVVYKEFERIFTTLSAEEMPQVILEVGAVPTEDSLMRSSAFDNVARKIGINLDGPHQYKDIDIVKGNANSMDCFEDHSFDLVLCNAMLEHDPYFWKTIAEINRITKPGGTIVIGVPGFDILKNEAWNEKFKNVLRKWPFLQKIFTRKFLGMLFNSTATFKLHNYPGDFYRYSPQAMEKVFFENLEVQEISSVMVPPRLIGVAKKPMIAP